MSRAEVKVQIVNSQGLHARPAHQIVLEANRFPCKISVANGDLVVDAKSIMSLMMLAAEKGTELVILAEGEKAQEAAEAIASLIQKGFGEE
ncbi:MAG TPA: HPr family phosphocarrier protein [Planctomycetes bacterium]|nr:HPr family phosphocarrier protein [Planctomycetota bacterium]